MVARKQRIGFGADRGKRHAARPDAATVRVGVVAAIPDVLAELDADPAAVLAEVGIDRRLFADPNQRISHAARGRLIQHCVARTDCAHFGLLVGQRAGLGSLGLVGLLAKYESDVGAALRSLVRFLHLHGRGAGVTLTVDGDKARLTYDMLEPGIEATDQIGDGALAILFNILRALCGPEWRPVAVRFAHRRPPDIRPFQRFFGAPLQFDDGHHALEFAAAWLRNPLSEADPELRRLLHERANALEKGQRGDLPGQVRAILHPALLAGRCTADRVAALLALHVRTLHRRLRADGTSFRALADEVRHEIARQLLGDTALDVADVAAALGYADASAFRRAFHRWTGRTPTQWRRQRRTA